MIFLFNLLWTKWFVLEIKWDGKNWFGARGTFLSLHLYLVSYIFKENWWLKIDFAGEKLQMRLSFVFYVVMKMVLEGICFSNVNFRVLCGIQFRGCACFIEVVWVGSKNINGGANKIVLTRRLVLATIVWHTWQERNNRTFLAFFKVSSTNSYCSVASRMVDLSLMA